MYAILMGLMGGAVCFFGATALKHALGYDDSLDAFGVHGLGGTLGAVLTGVFATTATLTGLETSRGGQITNQLMATAMTWVFAAVASFVLLKIVDVATGLRVTESDEYDGLDITQHGESGYNLEDAFSATFAGGGGATVAHDSVEVAPSVSRA